MPSTSCAEPLPNNTNMAQPRSFFARGKLLLTGEYAVVQGAEALAIPTVKGQHLTYHPGDHPLLWTALEADGSTWLSGDVATESRLSLVRSCIEAALNLKGSRTWPTGSVVTEVEFERSWGWGTSSTLIALIAQWLEVDALALHFAVSKGSGYDVACALADGPIRYRRTGASAEVTPVDLSHWPMDALHFGYLGQKRDSQDAVQRYLLAPMSQEDLAQITAWTHAFEAAADVESLKTLCAEHEAFLAARLGKVSPVAQRLQDAHAGGKSLGAWGGDFALVIAPEPEALHYLSSHGMGPILSWKEVCGG